MKVSGDKVTADVTVMVPGFGRDLFLLSPALHWAVLINTNGWYGCEELKSRRYKRVRIATNFASRLRSHRTDSEPPFTPNKPGIPLHSFHRSLVPPGFREISKS